MRKPRAPHDKAELDKRREALRRALSEGHRMTLCIAAPCEHDGKGAIVLLADTQGTYGNWAKSDDSHKLRGDETYSVLIAGDEGDPDELVNMIGPVMKAYHEADKENEDDFDLRVNGLLEDIRSVVRIRKRQLVSHMMVMNYYMTVEEFFDRGATTLPADTYSRILKDIDEQSLRCELIIAYVHDAIPIIITIHDTGRVIWSDNYSCIGSGDTIARSFLCQDDWRDNISLKECVYRLIVAKSAAHHDPHVGKPTTYCIDIQGVGSFDLADGVHRLMNNHLPKLYMPRAVAKYEGNLLTGEPTFPLKKANEGESEPVEPVERAAAD